MPTAWLVNDIKIWKPLPPRNVWGSKILTNNGCCGQSRSLQSCYKIIAPTQEVCTHILTGCRNILATDKNVIPSRMRSSHLPKHDLWDLSGLVGLVLLFFHLFPASPEMSSKRMWRQHCWCCMGDFPLRYFWHPLSRRGWIRQRSKDCQIVRTVLYPWGCSEG